MTRIIAYHVRQDEEPFIVQWSKENEVEVKSVPFELHTDTVKYAKGYDGIIFKQRSRLDENGSIYQTLKNYGIHQLSCRSAGIDTIDLHAAELNGIKVTNVPSYSPHAVAELVLMQAMQLIRHYPEFKVRLDNNDYVVDGLRSRELSEYVIGIVGVGRIGTTVAQIFHSLGATVLGNDLVRKPELERAGILNYVEKDEIYRKADIVTSHVYLNKKNIHLIDQNAFSKMKPTAFLINDSRGPVVNTVDLIAALKNKQIAGAALDVVEEETKIFNLKFGRQTPVANYNLLKQLPNVILTPHIAFYTDIAVERMVKQALDDALTIIQGKCSSHEISFKGE
ncbi:D-2-hydroxyacid dehydrogenase [Liquorilactobacillus mali]|uniref:D-lactate dehydrogenase n=1 Tax=Liquorilactobacillus mali TaxID=1618 RepID=A0A0R2FPF9_9LACO|nr:D-2-hydroxyacid dehydrogenase [Liquorilactobacillus mali]KRN26844.1 D-lactate dehydrogenase [Liquorilactobacillus mali]MDN7146522.1 D-2-hydroxyacid dehydrogenase [Liquorilactobacillus mali]